jgi:hypothetical protein
MSGWPKALVWTARDLGINGYYLNTAATFGGLFGPSIANLAWFRFVGGRDGRSSDVLAAAAFRRAARGRRAEAIARRDRGDNAPTA